MAVPGMLFALIGFVLVLVGPPKAQMSQGFYTAVVLIYWAVLAFAMFFFFVDLDSGWSLPRMVS